MNDPYGRWRSLTRNRRYAQFVVTVAMKLKSEKSIEIRFWDTQWSWKGSLIFQYSIVNEIQRNIRLMDLFSSARKRKQIQFHYWNIKRILGDLNRFAPRAQMREIAVRSQKDARPHNAPN